MDKKLLFCLLGIGGIAGISYAITPRQPVLGSDSKSSYPVSFVSYPNHVEVWVDDVFYGWTPCTINISKGAHVIGTRNWIYTADLVQTVDILGETVVTINLPSNNIVEGGNEGHEVDEGYVCYLDCESDVGAEIWVDSMFVGVTPLKVSIEPGYHYIRFWWDKHSLDDNFTIESGETLSMVASFSDMSINGHPSVS